MSHIAERDVAIKIQFPASGARYMQISVLRGNICVGGDGGSVSSRGSDMNKDNDNDIYKGKANDSDKDSGDFSSQEKSLCGGGYGVRFSKNKLAKF